MEDVIEELDKLLAIAREALDWSEDEKDPDPREGAEAQQHRRTTGSVEFQKIATAPRRANRQKPAKG